MLKELDLMMNKLGVAGAKTLVQILNSDVALKVLNIHSNSFGDEGVLLILDAIKVNLAFLIAQAKQNPRESRLWFQQCIAPNRERYG